MLCPVQRSFYPAGGENEGGLEALHPGKTGDFVREIGQFQVVFHRQ